MILQCNYYQIKKAKSAFTLIELLIVIAIIAILVSILIPSLQNARVKVKRAVCLSNLKQIYVAQSVYSGSNNDYFRNAVPNEPYFDSTIQSYNLHAWNKDHFEQFIEEYMGDRHEIFICPNQNANKNWWKWNSQPNKILTSYMNATNKYINPTTTTAILRDNLNYNIKQLSLVEDTRMMFFSDLIRMNPTGSWALADKIYKDGLPEGGNELQVDGSAKWRIFAAKQLNYNHGSWRYYWHDPR